MPKRGTIPKLEQLPESQKSALVGWLTNEGLTYTQAQHRLKSEFGVIACVSSFSAFYHNVCEPRRFAARAAQMDADTRIGRLLLQIDVRAMPDQSLSISVRGPAAQPAQV